MKAVIIFLLVAIFASLFGGVVFLVRDRGESKRLVHSLALRVSLAAALFLLLVTAILSGRIQPRSFPLQAPPADPGAAASPVTPPER